MPDILIKNLNNRKVPFTSGDKSVLQAIHNEFIDWMHTCGGKGRCTTCKMLVTEGMENISEISPAEEKYRAKSRLKEMERLSCQCRIFGDISIEVCEENKLPHLDYSY